MVLAPLVTPLLICLLWGQLQQLLGTTPGQVYTVIYFIKIGFLLTIHGVLSLSPLLQPRVLCVLLWGGTLRDDLKNGCVVD